MIQGTPLVRIHRGPVRYTRCRRCAEIVVYIDEVGWLDPDVGHSYDMCPRDRYGNHDADTAAARTSR